MNLSILLPGQEPSQRDAPVQVVLAYEGHGAFQAATEIYRAVAGRLTGQFEFRECWLPFSAFAEPLSLERSVNAAAEADLVFCCPNNAYFLPGAVQNWIRLSLARHRQPDGALAVLLPVTAGKSPYQTPVERDLRATAQATGLAFFCREYLAEPPRDLPSRLTKTRAHLKTALMGPAFFKAIPTCGIGESMINPAVSP